MKKKSVQKHGLLIVILVFLFAGAWIISLATTAPRSFVLPPSPVRDLTLFPKKDVLIKQSVTGSQVTYTGTIDLPDCVAYGLGIQAVGKNPTHITISFTVSRDKAVACTNRSDTSFALSFSGEKGDHLILDGVTVNKQKISSKVSPVEDVVLK